MLKRREKRLNTKEKNATERKQLKKDKKKQENNKTESNRMKKKMKKKRTSPINVAQHRKEIESRMKVWKIACIFLYGTENVWRQRIPTDALCTTTTKNFFFLILYTFRAIEVERLFNLISSVFFSSLTFFFSLFGSLCSQWVSQHTKQQPW